MIQQDYILRMIEQLGAFLRAIMRGEGSAEKLEGELDEMAVECLGLPLVVLLALPKEEAYRLLEDSERLVSEKSYMMAEICRAKALVENEGALKESLQEKARFFYERAQGQIGGEVESRIARRLAEGAGVDGAGEHEG